MLEASLGGESRRFGAPAAPDMVRGGDRNSGNPNSVQSWKLKAKGLEGSAKSHED